MLTYLKDNYRNRYDKNVSSDPTDEPVVNTDNGLFYRLKKQPLLIFAFVIILLFSTALGFFLQQQKTKPDLPADNIPLKTVSNQFLLEKVVIGPILNITLDSLLVKENKDLETKVLINNQTLVRIQKLTPPTKEEEQASGSAKLIGRLKGAEKATLRDILIGDQATITLEDKNDQLWARTITITRKVKE